MRPVFKWSKRIGLRTSSGSVSTTSSLPRTANHSANSTSSVCRGESRHLEFDIIGRDGTRRNLESRAVPLPDAKGQFMQLAVTRDVTDRKRAEAERNLLVAIIDSSDDIIVSKTLDGVITSWNKGAERVLGYTAEEVIGKHVSVLMPPDAIEDIEDDSRLHPAGRESRPLRDEASEEGRHGHRRLAHRVARPRCRGEDHRGIESRPRHHGAETSGSGPERGKPPQG